VREICSDIAFAGLEKLVGFALIDNTGAARQA
jgi:hypothetical protein